jgi:undecaprenyl-phosphate 4-deoxy-4-formamido-L-arabinose transferase
LTESVSSEVAAASRRGDEEGGVSSLSVVVPVFNSEGSLAQLVQRLDPVLRGLSNRFELILVNDGSQDRSWEQICKEASRREWIRGINLMRNYGQHNALLAGIRAAAFDIVVTMDDDLQHPPEEIPKLLEKLKEGYDVIYGIPTKEQHGLWRNVASRVTKLALQSAMGAEIASNVSAFRAFRSKVRDAFQNYHNPFVSIDVLLTWGTTGFAAVPVQRDPRRIGISNYTFRKLVYHALNMITGFSVLPLQLASLIGFLFALFGLGVLTFVLGRYLIQGGGVPGFPFLASIIAIFSGAQLLALGIIGEYLARMHFRTMNRPSYVIRQDIKGTG